MKHTWKKGLSLLLTFCLIAGLPPALRVSAADVTETEVADWAALTATENNSAADVTTDGNTTTVALKTYVKTTDTLTVPAGKYVLDLHNYGIRFTGDAGSAITVGAGAELTLEDTNRFSWAPTNYITLNESGRGTSAGSAYSSGATSVNRGYITGGNGVGNRITAGGVHVSADGKFIMNGGAIIGNYATNAGGVYIDPVWSASDGTESGSFTMNGGEITKNTAGGSGGGVYVNGNGVSSAASFTMTGGSITNNTAGAGASTSMGGDGGGVFARGSVTISGSSAITGNTTVGNEYGALGRGGGVYVHCGNMLSVSGTPNITGNTAGRVGVDGVHADNAFLATTTAIDSAISGTQATITVTGTLDSAARIGVTVEGTGAENTTVTFTSGLSGNGATSNFTSDAEYAVGLAGNEAALVIGSYAVQIGSAKYTSLATAMTALKNGDTLKLLRDVTTDGGLLFEGNKAVTLDLNGYGVRFTGDYGRVITVDSGVSLTLTDTATNKPTYYITLTDGCGTAVSTTQLSGTEGTDYVTVQGGYITGGNGGVRVYPDAVFTMNAGTILGNTANNGGGVYV
ncbi:MAG: hypothetical protein IJV64_00485, partial [Oscillospiraceae bacterium]|nr:hypothetical protein [Oscillospiraceae bacterium]